MAPRNDIDTAAVRTKPVRTKLWVPADRGGLPMIELAVPWVSRMTRSGFRSRLKQRVTELARRCAADTGTLAGSMAAREFAKARAPASADAPPEEVAAGLMNLPAAARLLDRIDWSRSPAKPSTNGGLPLNAWQQYQHLTLADFLALL